MKALKTLTCGNARAWLLDHTGAIIEQGFDPSEDGTVASWLVEAPWAHPMWSRYWLYGCHLRPIIRDGEPIPTKIYVQGATHELWLYAVDPDDPPDQTIERGTPHYLTPMNFGAQLILPSDAAFALVLETTAKDILEGRMNPDTDACQQWVQRFGDNMIKPMYRV